MGTDLLDRLVARFQVLEPDLNALDAAIGDGDHGTTILKGLRAAAAAPDIAVTAFRTAAGGASGTIFSLLLGALVQTDGVPLSQALAKAAAAIARLGGAGPGDKTMLDALLPASAAPDARSAALAARQGAEATRAMPARRGRARYVEGAGIGHLDPGAVSVAELLEVNAAMVEGMP